MRKEKVLVSGGAGFIGSHVVDLLVANDYDVVVVDNFSSGRRSNLNPAAKLYEVDIRSPELEAVFAAERPDFVNHHAAQVNVRSSIDDPMFDASVNILGSINVIELARKYLVSRFVYISTGGAVYGEPEYLPCDENHPIKPLCQYGASKNAVEHYLYLYHELYGLDYTVLRYPNVYGPRQDPKGEAGVIAIFTGRMLNGQQIVINGDGRQGRDFIYVGDCATANLAALKSSASGIFNLGSGTSTTINELTATLAQLTGYVLPPVHGPAILGETHNIYLSAENARRTLGWEQAFALNDGLKATVDYFRQHELADPELSRPLLDLAG